MAEIATVCPYCGCGCGIYLHVDGGNVVGVSPSRSHPVSQGRLCLKGWHAHEVVDNPQRLERPLVRRGDGLVAVPWGEALAAVADGLRGALESAGPQGVGVLGSARCTNEDNYVLARFARSTLGTGNIDCSLSIQCFPELSERRDGPSLGVSAGQLADLERSDLIFLVEGDAREEHPAVAARVYRARQRGVPVIAATTRRHALARLADVHLSVRPGTEARWLGSLLHVLLLERSTGREAGPDLATLSASVADLQPEKVEAEVGVPADALRRAAALYAGCKRAAVLYSSTLALSPQAAPALLALANLAALTRHGAGPRVALLSLLSRNNLQGCRDMGVSPHWLPGYVGLGEEEARPLSEAWGGSLCREEGLSAWQMLTQARALYVMGDDVIRYMPDTQAAREALEQLDFLVVQDIFLSPVAAAADVVLPAGAFAEREGTWTSLERRVQRIRPAAEPPGEAREDWRIVADVSRALGKPLPYETAQQVFEEIAAVVPIYAGLSYEELEAHGGERWPTTLAQAARETPLAQEELGLSERLAEPLGPAAADPQTNETYPVLLAADAALRPWDEEATVSHTMTVSGEFAFTRKDYPQGMLLVNPEDARRYGVRDGRNARVTSARGECQMRVRVSDEVPEGIALVPYTHATSLPVMAINKSPESGRPTLAPTPVAIGPAS